MVDGKRRPCPCSNRDGLSWVLSSVSLGAVSLRTMVNNAVAWANSRGLSRRNEVHGEWEYKIPLNANFRFSSTRSREVEGAGTFEVDDPEGSLFNFSDISAESTIMCL